ncbi:MAG TPA: zinc dependent phospholipase C family protein [Terracidiphilus sp.]|nr:zinc dependent phospholipase C family protein [Terracidiphilus sp.]
MRQAKQIIILILIILVSSQKRAAAYSLLTHEQLIDLTWNDSIVPLLLSRYPNLTPAQLKEAKAYAYGGCVIQDIGYYPFGDQFFSDLTHYVRTGDFVVNLFRNAHNADELAFAVGALSHYVGDSIGHSEATNLAVPVEFPKLRAEYGPVVSYSEGEHQHVQTEFAFDIDQIAHHHMAPLPYLRYIGLKVSMHQLAMAFYQTYGIASSYNGKRRELINVPAYRFAVRAFIPRIAYALTLLHRKHEPPEPDTPDARKLDEQCAQVAIRNDWQHYRRHAGIGTYALAGFIFVLPKFGPLKLLDIKGPSEATETDYIHSVINSTAVLSRLVSRFTPTAQTHLLTSKPGGADPPPSQRPSSNPATNPNTLLRSEGPLHPLPNRDLDTGRVVQPGGYSLTDSTYAKLLHRLTRNPRQPIPPGIKENIQAFYADPSLPITTKKDPEKWKQVQADLVTLAAIPTSTAPQPYPTYGDQDASH